MTDTERLDLIEHYKWRVFITAAHDWQVNGMFGHVRAKTLRKAIDYALAEQAKWALS